MKWKKLGKIFDPREHFTGDGFVGFAQSPQALVLENIVRIYFSTRGRDHKNGKYLSHIAYVDMDQRLQRVLGVARHQVIPLGKLGCFDEHGIFPINVLRHEDRVIGYTCGWSRRVSVSVDTAIGFCESRNNGLTFEKAGDGPIVSSSLNEPFLIGDPFVVVYDDLFHMWYIYGVEWKRFLNEQVPERVYKIAHATSHDGRNWDRESKQIIPDRLTDESQALPTVIAFNGTFHMFFCYRHSSDFRQNRSRAYRIGYAYSYDLLTWTRDDPEAGIDCSEGSWDSEMLCYPHAFRCGGRIYLLYNGNEFGRHGFGAAQLETPFSDWVPKRSTASAEQIAAHLDQCSDQFIPALKSRVELCEYAGKVFERSVTFEAWHGGRLIGLVAAYFNDPLKRIGFITNVSTLNSFMREGVATVLMRRCAEYARTKRFAELRLEVCASNFKAIQLYLKHGFTTYGQKGDSLYMKREIQQVDL